MLLFSLPKIKSAFLLNMFSSSFKGFVYLNVISFGAGKKCERPGCDCSHTMCVVFSLSGGRFFLPFKLKFRILPHFLFPAFCWWPKVYLKNRLFGLHASFCSVLEQCITYIAFVLVSLERFR